MAACAQCGAPVLPSDNFCGVCGTPTHRVEVILPPSTSAPPRNPHQVVAHGFGGVFGLHPTIAFFTIAVNLMLFGSDGIATLSAIVTGGADIPIAAPVALAITGLAGAAVGMVTYMGQKKWHGDDAESARIKGLITGILTAIPTGLPGMLFAGVAALGAFMRLKKV
jgi:hypothetical protein